MSGSIKEGRVGAVAFAVQDGVQYEVFAHAISRGFIQRQGVVRAIDLRSGEELWSRAAYPAAMIQAKKTDGGDRAIEIAIVSLHIEDGALIVENEKGAVYEMDLDGRSSRMRLRPDADHRSAFERPRA